MPDAVDKKSITGVLDSLGLGAVGSLRPVAGGDISAAWQAQCGDTKLFVKTEPLSGASLLSAEADGLSELHSAGSIRVPIVIQQGIQDDTAFLALEWLDLDSPTASSDARLGVALAEQHSVTRRQHGWHRDNWIGRTPQPNPDMESWIDFFLTQRLEFQLRLAAENGYGGELQALGRQLADRAPDFFDPYDPAPSLLHGDLWSGNHARVGKEPVVFDPAVYYGDRETDIAMSQLFGGFDAAFYKAYEGEWPLEEGWQQRVELYKLYHVLNHLNLFGSSYLGRATSIMASLLR